MQIDETDGRSYSGSGGELSFMETELLHWIEACFSDIEPAIFDANKRIWGFAEASGCEYRSSELLMRVLEQNGFSVRRNVCSRPTAFIAEYGSGHPVVGFLGEYDALPGLSQAAGVPRPQPAEGSPNGHGCGHCALGSGSLAAALMARRYLEEHALRGTVRYYGCCDEEVNGVKPHMARAGEFDDVDCVFAWHPGGETGVPNNTLLAMQSMHVTFTGEKDIEMRSRPARSACELMNVGVNYLRKRIIPEARINYAYLDANKPEPPDISRMSMIYAVRAPKAALVDELSEQVKACAEGAARMTGTRVEILPQNRYADRFQNTVVTKILSDAAQAVGPPRWDAADFALARAFVSHYDENQRAAMMDTIRRRYPGRSAHEIADRPLDTVVEPFDPSVCKKGFASSDVGDVGYAAPTASMRVACSALGNPAHSWFMTGMAASSIGEKGIACAAKILGLAALRVYEAPELLAGAQAEREMSIGSPSV